MPDRSGVSGEPGHPADVVLAVELGTRVVVRTRIEGGFTDALGYLRSRDETSCVIETKHGPVTLRLTEIVAAKRVPPPPARRASRPPQA